MIGDSTSRPIRAAAALSLLAASTIPAAASAGEPARSPRDSAAVVAPGGPSRTSVLRAASALDLPALEAVIRRRSPALQAAALDVDLAAAEVSQSQLLPNPSLDAAWSTIPLGATNPPNLRAPFANVPSYEVGLSYTILLGKRGPNQERARAIQRGASAALDGAARAQALALARLLGGVAVATLRMDGARGLVEDGERALGLAEARLAASFATPLDVDRLRIEVARSQQQILSIESDVGGNLAACASLVGAACEGFASTAEARGYLDRWIGHPDAAVLRLEDRPDLRALDAYRRAAEAEARLARAQAIPDPTVRLGYTHDRFIVSGNQMNSLNLSVSVPLPIFDHGQAQAQAAEAKRARYGDQRARAIEAAEARVPALARRVASQRRRQEVLAKEILPRAAAVLRDVQKAAENGLLPMSDVIQARRAVSELLIEQADSYGDAFEASLELAAELSPPSPPPVSTKEPTP